MHPYYLPFRRVLAMLLCAVFAFALAAEYAAAQSGNTHYIIFERQANGEIVPLFHRYVQIDESFASLSPDAVNALLTEGDRNHEAYAVTLATDANVVYRGVVRVPEWLRGEFHTPSGDGIDRRFIPLDRSSFVVRVPVVVGSELILQGAGLAAATHVFDPAAIAADPTLPLRDAPVPASDVSAQNNPANRVDLLILGDGYTAAQSGLFASHVANFTNTFFSITPYREYRSFVNVVSLFTASAQSGADHPPYNAACVPTNQAFPDCCPDSAAQSDPLGGQFVNTAFNATYCSYATQRLLVVNSNLAYAAAAAVPNWDQIMVIVNDTTYGGSGGPVGVFSTNGLAVDIAQHEYGHSFTGLADEYTTPYPGFPACSDTDANPGNNCEVNVTNQTVRNLIKWNAWIDPSTPIVTPTTAQYQASSIIGLFQGARYQSSGMYRPGYDCMMRSLQRPFCAVAAQAYPLRLYNGGWGAPNGGIDNIEPGSETPAATSTVNMVAGTTQVFQASLLAPQLTEPLAYAWYVNGASVGTGSATSSVSYSFTPATAGVYTVRLDVVDGTSLLHSSVRASVLTSRQWTVNVTPNTVNLISNGDFSLTPLSNYWGLWGVQSQVANGMLEIASDGSPSGGFYQFIADTAVTSTPLELTLNMANRSATPKTLHLLLRNASWSDTRSCWFTLPAYAPLQTYTMRIITADTWSPIVVQGWLTGDTSMALQLDNFNLRVRNGMAVSGSSECWVAPPINTNLVVDGGFGQGLTAWAPWNSTAQVSGGVFEIARNAGTPDGGFYQWNPYSAGGFSLLEFSFDLGSSTPSPQTINLLLRNPDWSQTRQCWLTVPGNHPLQRYTMRARVYEGWSNIVIQGWLQNALGVPNYLRLDNLDLRYLPFASILNDVECPEIGAGEAAPPPNASEGGILAQPAAPPNDVPAEASKPE